MNGALKILSIPNAHDRRLYSRPASAGVRLRVFQVDKTAPETSTRRLPEVHLRAYRTITRIPEPER